MAVSHGTVHACVEGPATGPLVVLVHGFMGSLATWERLSAVLHTTHGATVYALDLLGFGLSEKALDPKQVSDVAFPDSFSSVLSALFGDKRAYPRVISAPMAE